MTGSGGRANDMQRDWAEAVQKVIEVPLWYRGLVGMVVVAGFGLFFLLGVAVAFLLGWGQ